MDFSFFQSKIKIGIPLFLDSIDYKQIIILIQAGISLNSTFVVGIQNLHHLGNLYVKFDQGNRFS